MDGNFCSPTHFKWYHSSSGFGWLLRRLAALPMSMLAATMNYSPKLRTTGIKGGLPSAKSTSTFNLVLIQVTFKSLTDMLCVKSKFFNLPSVWITTQGDEKHLAGCLEDKVFPASKRFKQETKRSEALMYSCTCRLPAGGERMIACDNCGEWYHENCHNSVIPSEAWTDCNYKWTCDLC